MNLTVSLEELRAHEAAVKEWGMRRAQAAAEWLAACPIDFDHGALTAARRFDRGKFVAMLEAWDVSNPSPRLIPAV